MSVCNGTGGSCGAAPLLQEECLEALGAAGSLEDSLGATRYGLYEECVGGCTEAVRGLGWDLNVVVFSYTGRVAGKPEEQGFGSGKGDEGA